MSAIEFITQKLKEFPHLKYCIEDNMITVPPPAPDGFTVWLAEKNPGFTVGFDGWHEEFEEKNDALNWFAFGLSDQCRLKVVKRGKKACSWSVEVKFGNDWREDSETGLILVPFWKRKRIEYLSNGVIKGEE